MNRNKTLALAGTGLWFAIPSASPAMSFEERMEAMEKRVLEMEQRLEKSEGENARLRKQLAAQPAATPAASAAQAGVNTPDLKTLDQKIRLVERKLEIDKATVEAAKKTTATVEADPSTGFRIKSASGDHQLFLRGYVQTDGDFFMDDKHSNAVGVGLNASGQPNPIQQGTGLGTDKFWVRRARLQTGGTLFKYNDFLVGVDFGQGQARLFDAYMDMHYFPFASLSVGKQRGPVGLERALTATNLVFAERAYVSEIVPNREIGAMLHGEFGYPGYKPQYRGPNNLANFFTYQVGVYNGTLDNQAVQNVDTTSFDNKAFEGRLFAHPFQHTGIAALDGLGLGFAGTYATPTRQGNMPSLLSVGQNTILSYATGTTLTGSSVATAATQSNTPATGQTTTTTTTTTSSTAFSAALSNGEQYHIAPQGYWYWGPFGLMAEYALSSQDLAVQQTDSTTTAVKTDVKSTVAPNTTRTTSKTTTTVAAGQPVTVNQTRQNNQAWHVSLSYVLTGEDNTFMGVKPSHNFNPFEGQWGAFQIGTRWTELDIDKDTFKNFGTGSKPVYLFADPRASVQHATTWGISTSWWLNQNTKIMADYEQTYFQGGAVNSAKQVVDRPMEKVFFTRFQLSY
ncbi:phosphate-selective porin OprO and OprP [Methylomagnum ishizawai]|uniref:Phosphate-selective porin OprO and OprP n=1 Tax=Methylomagnum ishizawai TaxID=1760988 RepID=A0A1Y6D125_9GAMM|nr:carbohydrate porin [Methylomagnum ishizawai]SMF94262.1 phosphate-selective porin OprO and OprP [Methylomagnum ishizawai]